jgi:hypothetical protein
VQVSRPAPTELLAQVRRRRAELRAAMGGLEQALGSPVAGRDWAGSVRHALIQVDADFRMHVEVTEGPRGLYEQVLGDAPRLAGRVRRLTDEHRTLAVTVGELLAQSEQPADSVDAAGLRRAGTDLLARLARHRQAGADLLYEAYESDVGGET